MDDIGEAAGKGQRAVQSVEVGGRLLLALAEHPSPMTLKDLAARAHMPASRAQRVTRSRPCLSRSVSVKRHTPPLGVAPILASSRADARWRASRVARS